MHKIKYFLILLIYMFNYIFTSHSYAQEQHYWTQSMVADYSKNTLTNLTISNDKNGSVSLPHPIAKTESDFLDNSIRRFKSRQSSEEYITTWITNKNIYVQKHSLSGNNLSSEIQVNDVVASLGDNSKTRSALMENGHFLVLWSNLGYHQNGTDDNMYGQIFDSDNQKVGGNFKINESPNSSANTPVAFANETDSTFWILYSLSSSNGFRIFVQKRSILGEKIGETFLLQTDKVTKNEFSPSVSDDNNDNFVVVWDGNATNVSTYSDIYARRFDSNGIPRSIIQKVNKDKGDNNQNSPEVCFDENSNYLISWTDSRNADESISPYTSDTYGQFFNSTDSPIQNNFKINSSLYTINGYSDIEFNNDQFQISYENWNNNTSKYEIIVTQWKYDPKFSGEMISVIFDTGPGGSIFGNILWDELLPQTTAIKFKLRSSSDIETIENNSWYGPNNSSDYYTISQGELVNDIHNGDRYIQYLAEFDAKTSNDSPTLSSVSITYMPSDTIPPLIPKNFTATPGHTQIELRWKKNPESDIAKYRLYRGNITNNYDQTFTTEINSESNSFVDTKVLNGQKYFYALTSVDSSNNESNFSEEIYETPLSRTIFVNTNSSSAGDGSMDLPFKIIDKAMEIAEYGDKIIVLPGIYNEKIIVKEGITLQSSGIEPAIIQSVDEETMITMNAHSTLEGFIIIQNNSGFVILAEGVNISIGKNNIISETENSFATAIFCKNAKVEISQNFIRSFYQGIQGTGKMNSENQSNLTIHNNIIKCFWGIRFLEDCDAEIYNNTIIFGNENGDYGQGIKARIADNLDVKNNIFSSLVQSTGVAITNDGSSSTKIHSSFNNFWNHQTKYEGEVNEFFGCTNLDPKFEDFENNVFKLKANSPCIDAGDPQDTFLDINNTRNDMGAYGGSTPFLDKSNLHTIKKINIANCSGFPGDTISTYIILDTPNNLYSATIDIKFDSSILTYFETKLTDASLNFNYEDTLIHNNYISVSMNGNITDEYENNRILEISFVVNKTLASGDASPLSIKSTDLIDESLNIIYLTSVTDGVFVANLGSKDGKYVFVDINNTKAQDGSRTNPFNSVQDAIDFSSSGDTIIVAPGEYYGPFTMKDSTFLKGSGASVTELNIDSDLYFDTPVVSFESINHSTISGFTIHSQELMEAAAIYCNNSSPIITENYFIAPFINADATAIICNNQSNPLIQRNTSENCKIMIFNSSPNIKNNTLSGAAGGMSSVDISENSSPIISQNTIYTTMGSGAGISIFNSSPTIENNIIISEDYGGQGLYISKSDSCIIRNNIILDSNDDGIGLFIKNSTNINVYNNTISTKQSGIWAITSTGFIYNNIITNSKLFGIQASEFSNIDYNCLWNNLNNYENTTTGDNDIFLDPLFENTNSNLFTLAESSPCINTGNPILEFNDSDNSRNDIGAYGGPFADLSWIGFENSSLEIINENSPRSDTIQFVINGSNISKIADIDLSLSYDSNVLEFLNAESTYLTKSFSVSKLLASNNNVDLDLNSRNGITSDSGSVVLLSFLNIAESSTTTYLNFSKANLVDDVLSNRSISQLKNGEINIIVTDVENTKIPSNFNLSQNYPNPFNPTTIIRYDLPQKSFVEINIYDILGRQVYNLVNEEKLAGNYQVDFNAKNLSSGVYFYRIKAGNFTKVKKMVLVR